MREWNLPMWKYPRPLLFNSPLTRKKSSFDSFSGCFSNSPSGLPRVSYFHAHDKNVSACKKGRARSGGAEWLCGTSNVCRAVGIWNKRGSEATEAFSNFCLLNNFFPSLFERANKKTASWEICKHCCFLITNKNANLMMMYSNEGEGKKWARCGCSTGRRKIY